MFGYIATVFQEIWKGPFWAGRWATFLSLLRKPTEFFKGVGKKEWDQEAYLFGITASLATLALSLLMSLGLLISLPGWWGLKAWLISLLSMGLGWFIGLFLTYYVVAWFFGLAAKLVLKKELTDKIRPILFAALVCGLPSVIPFLGGLLALAAFILVLVIAYENGLKVERGSAIGCVLLGMLFTGLAYGLVILILLGLSALAGFSIWGLSGWRH